MMSIPSHLATMSRLLSLLPPLFLLLPRVVVGLPPPPRGDPAAVLLLLHRVLPPSGSSHFDLSLTPNADDHCAPGVSAPCFVLSDGDDGRIRIEASTASELSAGVGHYLRRYCNMTVGWPRGGGSNVFVPAEWPAIGSSKPVAKRRNSPYSYLMNVCTHSYSLAWYSWSDWQGFIDWLALSGINLILATTGQEEVQYKVFRKLGLGDYEIRNWFNGPALLTWSRGQNEYGSGMLGPLPRSWMRDQWNLQRKILPRLRSLGIVGQLPGFQGNVPVQLKALLNDTNITEAGGTGWMDSLDPMFGKVADLWMETLIADFGTDHWYQLDGYFDGGTAPWFSLKEDNDPFRKSHSPPRSSSLPPQESSTLVTDVDRDIMAFKRAASAYMGLNRTDPEAVWSCQGFAFFRWSTPEQAAELKGYIEGAPWDKFVIIDMDLEGGGQWRMFNNSAFFGAQFIWTSLHNFGGTDGMKGNLSVLNGMPFNAPSHAHLVGTGATPEGVDQNAPYYEFIFEQNFRDAPVEDLVAHTVERSYSRYGLLQPNNDITQAWTLLAGSVYTQDLTNIYQNVQDGTGVAHLPPRAESPWFGPDRRTPKKWLCDVFAAWEHLIRAGSLAGSDSTAFKLEPFVYDLVNTGREVLANLATPASFNFSDAVKRPIINKDEVVAAGSFYLDLLNDVDALVGTDTAFLIGPWIEMARRWGRGHSDCRSSALNHNMNCENFLEWNARTQLTTWKPTPEDAPSIPAGPVDYAAKHWNGLVRDYYGGRARLTLQQALSDEASSQSLNKTALDRLYAKHAYNWTTAVEKYPMEPVGDALTLSQAMHAKYGHWFASCNAPGMAFA